MKEETIEKLQVGDVFDGIITRIMEFGAFVEIVPGIEGLVHISELSHQHIQRVQDIATKGDRLKVKLIKKDEWGRIRLSHKALLENPNKT